MSADEAPAESAAPVGAGRIEAGAAVPEPARAHDAADPVRRPVGLETEFGILQPGNPHANPVALATRIVAAYAGVSRPGLILPDGTAAPPVRWDYEGEDPLTDLRGGRLDRDVAHPSLLTDDPELPAPSGDAPSTAPAAPDPPPAPWGTRPRPSAAEAFLPHATTTVLTNGARLYVDHAHPEYSSPEVVRPRDAVVWDRAGELVARRAMDALAEGGDADGAGQVVLYKNNVDGKGAAYGSHESYLLRRDVPFMDVAQALIPFLVTRPVIAGAGRVGIGQHSQAAGFQIAQRADYIETDIGLQTTFNRPIVNTRDEPHADAARFRRLHVINGDANRFEVPIALKVASTSLVLWYLEREHDAGRGPGEFARLELTGDAVEEQWALSHDTTLAHRLSTRSGRLTAIEVQRRILDIICEALIRDYGGLARQQVGEDTCEAVRLWSRVVTELEDYARAVGTDALAAARSVAARDVEWLAKLELCEGLRARSALEWDDPKLAALDIQWSDLRAGRGLAEKVMAAGRTRRLATEAQIDTAVLTPPTGTRARVRGRAVAEIAEVVAASWTSIVLDLPGHRRLERLVLTQVACDDREAERLLDTLRAAVGPIGVNEQH